MFRLLVSTLIILSIYSNIHAAMTCATSEKIKDLSDEEAIQMAYESGPKAGNFGLESLEGLYGGIYFISKENAIGNSAMLDMYPTLNNDIFKKLGLKLDENYKHNYSGIFHATYFGARECRRQLLITGTETGTFKAPFGESFKGKYFTGRINVEICDPNIMELFAAGSAFFEAKKAKMENFVSFLSFIDEIEKKGKIKKEVVQQIKENLDPKNFPGALIYYAKGADGHIAPRFSLKIKHMFFEESGGIQCRMNVVPTAAYSGVLDHEEHSFSNEDQKTAHSQSLKSPAALAKQSEVKKVDYDTSMTTIVDDQDGVPLFIMSYWKDKQTIGLKSAVINSKINTP